MNRFSIKIFLVLLVAVLSIHSSCPEDKGNNRKPSGPYFPTSLADPIPFDKLGQGKLVFGRIGPIGANYSGVYVINIDSQTSWGIGGGVFSYPAVSPNGQKIAFCRLGYETYTGYDIHIMDIDGSNIERVSNLQSRESQPSWTPDSNQILYFYEAWTFSALHIKNPTLYGGYSILKT